MFLSAFGNSTILDIGVNITLFELGHKFVRCSPVRYFMFGLCDSVKRRSDEGNLL